MLYLIYIHHTAHQYQPSFPTPTLFRSSRNNRGDERRINPRQLGFVQPQTALGKALCYAGQRAASSVRRYRSEEHTSELQSRRDLVCRLLLEKKKYMCEYILSYVCKSVV